jgi:hypothetical protein
MTKIVINTVYGGFGLSHKALNLYNKLSGRGIKYDRDISRDDPYLIQVVKEFNGEVDGEYAKLKIVEIPDDVEWDIEEYDGVEHIVEKHRKWR